MTDRFSGTASVIIRGSYGIGIKIANDLSGRHLETIIVSGNLSKLRVVTKQIINAECITGDMGVSSGYKAVAIRIGKSGTRID
jgi:short-subunit dehydrogenase